MEIVLLETDPAPALQDPKSAVNIKVFREIAFIGLLGQDVIPFQ